MCVTAPRLRLTLTLFVTRVGSLTAEKVTEESNVLLLAGHQRSLKQD